MTYLINTKTHEVVGKMEDREEALAFIEKSKAPVVGIDSQDALGKFKAPFICKLYKALSLGTIKKKDPAYVEKIWKVLESLELKGPERKKTKKKAKKEKGPSRYDKIVALFKEHGPSITVTQIQDSLGIKSPSACMASLANPKKAKRPLSYFYDRSSQTFTFLGHADPKFDKEVGLKPGKPPEQPKKKTEKKKKAAAKK